MFTSDFWLGDNGAIVRAVRTFAQTAVATIGVGQTNLFSADLQNILALSVSAAVISLLMSLDRREALHSIPPVPATAVTAAPPLAPPPPAATSSDPASADYQP